MFSKLLRVGYAVVALKGLFSAVAPRLALRLDLKWLSLGLKNVSELEPREWYVTAVRATGVGMLAAGGVGLLLTGDDEASPEDVEPIDIAPDDDAVDEDDED